MSIFLWLVSALLGAAGASSATTIVTLLSSRGIVICSDGKSTIEGKPTAGPSRKVFILSDRVVIVHAGVKSIDVAGLAKRVPNLRKIPYTSDNVIDAVQKDVNVFSSLLEVAGKLRNKLLADLANLDQILPYGSRSDFPPPGDVLTVFDVVGYDGSQPKEYEVGVDLDWTKRTHRIPPPGLIPQRKNVSPSVLGSHDSYEEMFTPGKRGFADARELIRPELLKAFQEDRELSLQDMKELARAIVDLQVIRDPANVGYPLTMVVLRPRSKTEEQKFLTPLPRRTK